MSKKDKQQALVPRLRFPEFRDSWPWTSVALDECCERLTEKVGDAQLTPVSITAGTGFVPQAEKFGRDISGAQYSKYIRIERGDFAYNRGNSKRFPQGCVYQLTEFDEAAASNAFYCFRLHKEYEPEFFEGLFEANCHGQQLIKYITSSARSDGLLNIKADTFFGITIPMPPRRAEQRKIAACLGSLDNLIAAEARKLAALRKHKKGLMQQLFPREGETQPRLRFPEFLDAPDWKERALGELVEVATGQVDPTEPPFCDMPHVSSEHIIPNGGGLRELQSAKELGQTSGKYLFEPTDLLYSKIRPALNKVASPNIEGTCSADIYPIRVIADDLTRTYLFYLLLSDAFLQYALKNSARSKIPKLNRETLLGFLASIPDPSEQQRIAGCLATLDAMIAAQAEKLDALRTHKRGLMQQLFPLADSNQ